MVKSRLDRALKKKIGAESDGLGSVEDYRTGAPQQVDVGVEGLSAGELGYSGITQVFLVAPEHGPDVIPLARAIIQEVAGLLARAFSIGAERQTHPGMADN